MSKRSKRRILVLDIGGSKIKLLTNHPEEPVEILSGPHLTPKKMMAEITPATADWEFDAVSIGYPGRVRHGAPAEDAPNLGRGWMKFNFQKAFGCPVQIINDAALQALGSYEGGRMLFLGLGTGLGSTLILDGLVHPLELGDLPFRHGRPYWEYLGKAGLKRLGKRSWARHAYKAIKQLHCVMEVDYTVVGGGQAKLLRELPPGTKRGDNAKAFLGGCRLWDTPGTDDNRDGQKES